MNWAKTSLIRVSVPDHQKIHIIISFGTTWMRNIVLVDAGFLVALFRQGDVYRTPDGRCFERVWLTDES